MPDRRPDMRTEFIRYAFTLPNGSEEMFELHLDAQTLDLVEPIPEHLPEWTALAFKQCPHCPLVPATHPRCPLAVRLVPVVNRFDGLISHDEIHVSVITEERKISQKTTAQRGIGSLMGLLIATSGCPHTAVFKPMARFHLPLASREETVYRATSMYLLAQYFLKKRGMSVDFELGGLQDIYRNMEIINASIVKRLQSATETDSLVNGVIILDIYAKTLDFVINESLERVGHLFDAYVDRLGNRSPEPPAA